MSKIKKKKKPRGIALEGIYMANARGYGFVSVSEEEEDIFVSEEDSAGAMDRDRVRVMVQSGHKEGRKREGVISEILERAVTEVVGTYEKNKKYGFVISDNSKITRDIYIPVEDSQKAKNGDKVVAAICDYGTAKKSPVGYIKEILGKPGEKGTDILSLVRSYGIPDEFPEKVRLQAERVPDHILEADLDGRCDLRDMTMVTIDGEDARDLDDAVSLTVTDNVYHLGVHIADVSNYVQGGSALDKEALKRGTSVYLPDRVIPMLPKRLSNGICSLNAGEDRLALSCLMDFDKEGNLLSHRIVESVICVKRRMSYSEVKAVLEGESDGAGFSSLVPMLKDMHELSKIIREKRKKRGSIDFDFPECKIILNEAGKAIDLIPYETNAATELIEDFMLMANETVAREYREAGLPFVYRVHEQPDEEKIENLLLLFHNQGLPAVKAGQSITPLEIQKLLELAKGRPEEAQLSRLTLRTMKQARYSTDCTGHFGLAASDYCHFTSPIRRYPDLIIHRIIRDHLRGRLARPGRTEKYHETLDAVAQQSSMCERRAQELEREADKLKKAEYMSWHLGETYEGIISGVTGWGIYVELPNTVEGLVHVTTMRDDYYYFDQEAGLLKGERTGKQFVMGQKVRVRLMEADMAARTIDFVLE